MIRKIGSRKKLYEANVLIDIADEAANIGGMALGGFLIWKYGVEITVIFSIISIILSIGQTLLIKFPYENDILEKQSYHTESFYETILKVVKSDESLLKNFFIQAFLTSYFSTFPSILSLFLSRSSGMGSALHFGSLESLHSISYVTGSLIIVKLSAFNKQHNTVPMHMILLAIFILLFIYVNNNFLKYTFCGAMAFSSGVYTLTLSSIQVAFKENFEGRLQSILTTIETAVIIFINLLLISFNSKIDAKFIYIVYSVLFIIISLYIKKNKIFN